MNDSLTKFKFVIMCISLWLMISAFFIGQDDFEKINALIIGVSFSVFSFALENWQKWFILVCGIILIVASFSPIYTSTFIEVTSGATNTQISTSKALTWNIIVGIITLLVVFVPVRIES